MERLYSEFDATVHHIVSIRRASQQEQQVSLEAGAEAVAAQPLLDSGRGLAPDLIPEEDRPSHLRGGRDQASSAVSNPQVETNSSSSDARRLHEWHSVHRSASYFQVGLQFRCGDKSFLLQVRA